jgi:tetratricopeptide (TPR) repeat protein
LLELVAERLGCPVEYLRTGRGMPAEDEGLALELRFAELALRSGDPAKAEQRFRQLADRSVWGEPSDTAVEARWGLARAREALGELPVAIAGYEELASLEELPASLDRTTIETALCRAYSECGDLGRAIEVGETALRRAEDANGEYPNDSVTDLASTLVGCYYERGDLTRAQLLAERTIARAEGAGSPRARASAYWNAALVAEARSELRTARVLVERALALYSETDNARAIALLRVTRAWLLLRTPDASLSEVKIILERALAELPAVGTPVDVAYAETEYARWHLVQGEWEGAATLARSALERLSGCGYIEAARAGLVLGHALLDGGRTQDALEVYTEAANSLAAAGAVRQAGAGWRELAEALIRLGRTEEALDAFRHAADAMGLQADPYAARRLTHSSAVDRSQSSGQSSR